MCAKLRTVAASNNRDHTPRLFYACSRHIYLVRFFAHFPFVVKRAFNTTPTEWLQQCVIWSRVLHITYKLSGSVCTVTSRQISGVSRRFGWESVVLGLRLVPATWGVNVVVAGAQVSLPAKQPDVLELTRWNKRLSPLCPLITLQQYSKLTASFAYIQIYNKTSDKIEREVRNTQRNGSM